MLLVRANFSPHLHQNFTAPILFRIRHLVSYSPFFSFSSCIYFDVKCGGVEPTDNSGENNNGIAREDNGIDDGPDFSMMVGSYDDVDGISKRWCMREGGGGARMKTRQTTARVSTTIMVIKMTAAKWRLCWLESGRA